MIPDALTAADDSRPGLTPTSVRAGRRLHQILIDFFGCFDGIFRALSGPAAKV
jgi:hypothetical protein